MSSVAVIGTFYGRHESTGPLLHALYAGSRKPDEAWLIGETVDDYRVLRDASSRQPGLTIKHLPTPTAGGKYRVIPYSNKINWALDQAQADLIVYLDNGSMPHPDKIKLMAGALEDNENWGAVYCTQARTGYVNGVFYADSVVEDGYCAVNYTQVMHRRTPDRWPLSMAHADPDFADALFWRKLHKTLGSFYPVAHDEILDVHHMPSEKAQGLQPEG